MVKKKGAKKKRTRAGGEKPPIFPGYPEEPYLSSKKRKPVRGAVLVPSKRPGGKPKRVPAITDPITEPNLSQMEVFPLPHGGQKWMERTRSGQFKRLVDPKRSMAVDRGFKSSGRNIPRYPTGEPQPGYPHMGDYANADAFPEKRTFGGIEFKLAEWVGQHRVRNGIPGAVEIAKEYRKKNNLVRIIKAGRAYLIYVAKKK